MSGWIVAILLLWILVGIFTIESIVEDAEQKFSLVWFARFVAVLPICIMLLGVVLPGTVALGCADMQGCPPIIKRICRWWFVALLALSILSVRALAVDTISFNPSIATNVTNYILAYGPTNRATTNRISLGTNTVFVVTNLSPGTVSFLYATAQANGIESNPSNEILYTNRNFAPNTLRLSGTDALILQSSLDGRTWQTLATITSAPSPLIVSMQPRSMFRTLTTNMPPIPR